MITQHIKELVSRKFSELLTIIFEALEQHKICKSFSKQGETEQCLGSTLRNFVKIDVKVLSVSRPLPIFPERISQILYNTNEVYYQPQKNREIGGALRKNGIFHTMSLYFHPSPSKFGHSLPMKFMFLESARLGQPIAEKKLTSLL